MARLENQSRRNNKKAQPRSPLAKSGRLRLRRPNGPAERPFQQAARPRLNPERLSRKKMRNRGQNPRPKREQSLGLRRNPRRGKRRKLSQNPRARKFLREPSATPQTVCANPPKPNRMFPTRARKKRR